ncbi:MAG: serine/threonine protein kinase, partial [Caldilineae bacterium]
MTKQASPNRKGKDAWFPKGKIIAGRYELARPLGSGGWGQVYLARDRVLGRQVAVKRLLPSLSVDEEAVERFHREASVIASVQDPHVLTIFDTIREGDDHFIIMEYADAGTLSQALRWEGMFNAFETLNVAIDVCKGLRAVHNKGIIHRDIKPANVLFFSRSDGFPLSKLADFGIAIQPDDQRLTPQQRVLGTLIYLSPEQVSGYARLTPASDLYSLGVIMYEMMAGELDEPFFLRRIEDLGHQEGLEHFARFPEPLQPTLYRVLQSRPAARFQSADEMLQALERTRGRLTASLATQRILEETLEEMRRRTPPSDTPVSALPPQPPP